MNNPTLKLSVIAAISVASILVFASPASSAMSVTSPLSAGPAASRLAFDNCVQCSMDDLGFYCDLSPRGASLCEEHDYFREGQFIVSMCEMQGQMCGFVYAFVAPDGAGRQTEAARGGGTRWAQLADGERVLRDCAGVIVAREMTAERASVMRRELDRLTL